MCECFIYIALNTYFVLYPSIHQVNEENYGSIKFLLNNLDQNKIVNV